MKPKKFNNKRKQKTTATTQQDLGFESGDETKITAMGIKVKESISSTSISNCHTSTPNEQTRIELFHVRVISKNTKIDTLFDSGSQANLISEDLVKKLNLETILHPKPYQLGWICKDTNLKLTRKCIFQFEITTNFINEVELNVVSLDISGIVLGSPYLSDRKEIFYHHENMYHLFNDGVEYIVRDHHKKLNLSLFNVGKIKRLVNSSNNLVLLMIKPKTDVDYEAFEGCDTKLKSDCVDVFKKYDDKF